MIIVYLIFAALFVGFYFAERADVRVSEEGFKRKYQEGDELITKIFKTQTPTGAQLTLFNYAQLIVWLAPTYFFPLEVVIGWGYAVLAASIGTHLLAVRKWRKAFATGGKSLYESRTWFQKFLGL